MNKDYLVISEHGLVFRVKADESMSNLKFMQALVGGLIQSVPYHGNGGNLGNDGVDCWVNEEGLILGMNMNMTASIICNHMLAGTAVFAGHDGEGNITPCPENFITTLTRQGLALEGEGKSFDINDAMGIIKLDNEGVQDAKSL